MAGSYDINHAAVTKLLFGKAVEPGFIPIYHDLNRRAKAVQREAKVLVGKDSGRLASRITLTSRSAPPYWWFQVEGNTRYAYWHHQGTKPHVIEGSLSFRSGGRVIHPRLVHHPGTRGNPFLRNALPAFMGLGNVTSLRP
jgi:hypothetical protein